MGCLYTAVSFDFRPFAAPTSSNGSIRSFTLHAHVSLHGEMKSDAGSKFVKS